MGLNGSESGKREGPGGQCSQVVMIYSGARERRHWSRIYNRRAEMRSGQMKLIARLARTGVEERTALFEGEALGALYTLCSKENDIKIQVHAAYAISALASNFTSTMDENRVYAYAAVQTEATQLKVVHTLTASLTSWQPELQAAAADALASLCYRNSEVRREMGRMDACRLLVNLLYSQHVDVHKAALCALRAYCVEPARAQEVEQREALSQICKLSRSDKDDVVFRALSLAWMLAGADSIKEKLATEEDGGFLKYVVSLLKSNHRHVQSIAATLLRKISLMKENARKIFDDTTKVNIIGCLHVICLETSRKETIMTNQDLKEFLETTIKTQPRGGKAKPSKALESSSKRLHDFLFPKQEENTASFTQALLN
eukprot:754809-Hanusia_phi.AAC.3